MNKNAILPLVLLFIISSVACKKLSTTGEYTPTSSQYSQIPFLEQQIPEPQIFEFNIDSSFGDTILYTAGEDGIEINFNVDSIFNPDGSKATGEVTLEHIGLVDKSDFIFANMPTTVGRYPLESAGSHYIRVKQNGTPLLLKRATIIIRQGQDSLQRDMGLYLPEENALDNRFTWREARPSEGFINFVDAGDTIGNDTNFFIEEFSKYALTITNDSVGWINCDRFYESEAPTGLLTFCFDENDEILLDQTVVFVVFKNFNGVMTAIRNQNTFFVDNVPAGEPISVAAISFEGIDVFGNVFSDTTRVGYSKTVKMPETTEAAILDAIRGFDN